MKPKVIRFLNRFIQKISRYKFVQLLVNTVQKWQADNCAERAAALAYYTFFSLFPFMLVILSLVSLLVDPETNTFTQILNYAEQVLPLEAYDIFEQTLIQFSQDREIASFFGFGLLLLSGSRFLDSLDRSFDAIWGVQHRVSARAPGWISGIVNFISRKLLALGLVIVLVIILYLAPLLEIAIGILVRLVETFSDQMDLRTIDTLTSLATTESIVSFILLVLMLMLMFRVLPSTRVEWGDVWLGSMITAILFKAVQSLISSGIISLSRNFQAYGVVGSVMVIIFWLYLTGQLMFLGGEFTYFYAQFYGSRRFNYRNNNGLNGES